MNAAETLAKAKRASLVAPAGCGKTYLIAEAIANYGGGRELVLTHTHAGVDVLRRRLKSMGVPSSAFNVETIAGFALRYASSFPRSSGLGISTPVKDQWDLTYTAAQNLFQDSPVIKILTSSYSGIYVDEYQDCTVKQHALVLELARVLPSRILGDPLQGIFDFGKNQPVDWNRDVCENFEAHPELNVPWRWKNANTSLGKWLLDVRHKMIKRESIDISKGPIKWVQLPDKAPFMVQTSSCSYLKPDAGETVVAIHKLPHQCHTIASKLRGKFSCVEPIDSDDLLTSAEKIQSSEGHDRVEAVLLFANCCMTKVKSELGDPIKRTLLGKHKAGSVHKYQHQLDCMKAVSEDISLKPVSYALAALKDVPGVVLYRKELFYEMQRSLREFMHGNHTSLADAVWHIRNITSRTGRTIGTFTIGRTLLVKGLEFDHAVILDAGDLDLKNLYVAMTRGSKSLTILSRQPIIRFGK